MFLQGVFGNGPDNPDGSTQQRSVESSAGGKKPFLGIPWAFLYYNIHFLQTKPKGPLKKIIDNHPDLFCRRYPKPKIAEGQSPSLRGRIYFPCTKPSGVGCDSKNPCEMHSGSSPAPTLPALPVHRDSGTIHFSLLFIYKLKIRIGITIYLST